MGERGGGPVADLPAHVEPRRRPPLADLAHDLARRAHHHRIVGNLLAFGDQGAGPDDALFAYDHAVHQDRLVGKRNLVDVRSPDEFTGRLLAPAHLPQEQAQRAGHIPTARNVPWSKAANEDGTFRSDDELRSLYAGEAGLDFGRDTIAYCRIGERSAHTWFVLHELLGQPNVKNYDGSWTEYGSLVGVPVALGDDAGSADA